MAPWMRPIPWGRCWDRKGSKSCEKPAARNTTDSCFQPRSQRLTFTLRNNTDRHGRTSSIYGHSPIVHGGITEAIESGDQMAQYDKRDTQPSVQDVALIVGGGPGISSSCARLFTKSGMRVGITARNP